MLYRLRPTACSLMLIAACIAPAAFTRAALAVQHLVRPGDDWQALGQRLRPGDEIILMPGRHRPASFEKLIGTAERPITIRSLNPKSPGIIESLREGIRARHAAHLTIKDLEIIGGTVNGISIGQGPNLTGFAAPPGISQIKESEAVPQTQIVIQSVSIKRIGPRGLRHGIQLWEVDSARIVDCTIEGWGGSGIELVACRSIHIQNCRLAGLEGHGQMFGIRARAGSQNVRVERCRFESAGEHAIFLGGDGDVEDFVPAPKNAPAAPLAEASRVQIEHCSISGSLCAIAFSHADDCIVRNNLIVRPTSCVVSLQAGQADTRLSLGQRNIFGYNIILWEPGDLRRLVELASAALENAVMFEDNIWWANESAAARKKLGSVPGKISRPQITDVNPQLDEEGKPQNRAAAGFGPA